MKITSILLFFFFAYLGYLSGENRPLLQNVLHRDSQTLNGLWHYIVDMNETGYYNYRWEAYDEQEKPRASAYFTNSKPKHSRDLIEYDFDSSPTLRVPEIGIRRTISYFIMKERFGIKSRLMFKILMPKTLLCSFWSS